MLQEGDIWLSEGTERHHSIYIFRMRVWRKGAWRDKGKFWSLADLVDQNTNKGLQKIENRPRLATYTGIYRYEKGEESVNTERTVQLEALVKGYYTAAQIRKAMNDPAEYDVRNYEQIMDSLMKRTGELLNLEPGEELACICGCEIAWLLRFFGVDYLESHVDDCPDCGQHTLHVSDESARCVNPDCQHSSGVDAEGNVYKNGQIVSNGGKSIDQLRCAYFDGYSFML